MTTLIGFPFKLDGNGSVVTLDDASDDYAGQELAVLVLTNVGERELVPDFGITDPTHNTFDEVEFVTQVEKFQIPVTVNGVDQNFTDVNRLVVDIDYDTLSDFSDEPFDSGDPEEVLFEEGEL